MKPPSSSARARVVSVVIAVCLNPLTSLVACTLNVPQDYQEQDQWCWAACSQAVLAYYGTNVTQTQIAQYGTAGADIGNWLFGSSTNPTMNGVDLILYYFQQITSTGYTNALSQDVVRTEICTNVRPVVIGWNWTSGGGHMIVIRGLDDDGTTYLMDPWYGPTINTFSWVLSGDSHIWTETLQLEGTPCTLTVASSNPVSGVSIAVSPSDNNAQNNGTTQFTRTYNKNTIVTLTAPSNASGNNFQMWQRDGADWTTSTSATLTTDAGHTLTAVYVTPPNAIFSASPSNGVAPLTVNFSDTSAGNITNRFWDFGDGATTNIATTSVSHTYVAGTYTVTLTVSGPDGIATDTQSNCIGVITPFQAWQIQYFGSTTNPLAAANVDADGTCQNNQFKYAAGLDPTNPASVFMLEIQNVPNQPTHKNLIYGPIANGRTYVAESTTDLLAGVWTPQAVSAPLTNLAQVTVTDPSATTARKFYRIEIFSAITNIVIQDSVGDGISDPWRAQYFPSVDPTGETTNNLSCASCDADGTGQNNYFKYVAGLDPTNPASVFVLGIAATNQPSQNNLMFTPLALGRTYTPQFSTNLPSGVWLPLTTYAGPLTNNNGTQVTITDANPIPPQEFYRIGISLPGQ